MLKLLAILTKQFPSSTVKEFESFTTNCVCFLMITFMYKFAELCLENSDMAACPYLIVWTDEYVSFIRIKHFMSIKSGCLC